jgi:hypothetical protein
MNKILIFIGTMAFVALGASAHTPEEPWALPADTVSVMQNSTILPPPSSRPFYMNVRTNLLYDAAVIPNVGLEFALGEHWSVGSNLAWVWWTCHENNRYWRVFGVDLNVRRWFGGDKPLTGHHVGVYAEALTYDVMLSSKRGYLGGRTHGGLLEHPSRNVGVEYGFALPIGRHLNLDFTLGLGYFRSDYYKYKSVDVHYVWQETKRLHWVGPTKAEVSLVWLLGNGYDNNKKGGRP